MTKLELAKSIPLGRASFYSQAEAAFNSIFGRWEDAVSAIESIRQQVQYLRSNSGDYIASGNRSPKALTLIEMAIESSVPFYENSKAMPAAQRQQRITEAKSNSVEWLKVTEHVRQVAANLQELADQQDMYTRQMRGLEIAIQFLSAGLEFFRR